MFLLLSVFISISFSNSNNSCIIEDYSQPHTRTVYAIGDTLTIDDQNTLYPVCNGSGAYQTGDSFSFSDLNGSINGGDYKITIISMNATW